MVRGLLGTSFFYFALLALAPQVVWRLYCRLSLLYPFIDGCVRSTSTNLSLSVWPLNEKFCRWMFLGWVCGRPRQLDNRGEERELCTDLLLLSPQAKGFACGCYCSCHGLLPAVCRDLSPSTTLLVAPVWRRFASSDGFLTLVPFFAKQL